MDKHKLGGAYWVSVDDWPHVRRWLTEHLGTPKETGRWRRWYWTTTGQLRRGYRDSFYGCCVVVIWDEFDADRFEDAFYEDDIEDD